MRWIRLEVEWRESEWILDLSPVARLCWVLLLCDAKTYGVGGRTRAWSPAVLARRWDVPAEAAAELVEAAVAHDAVRVEDDHFVLTEWVKYQETDRTAAKRQARKRQKNRELDESHGVTTVTPRDEGRDLSRATETETETETVPPRTPPAPSPTGSTPPAPAGTPFLEFPISGTGGPTWTLTAEQVTEWDELYPGVRVGDECRKALAWIKANPERRKTAKGMPKYLTGWLNRAQDTSRNFGTGSNGTARRPLPATKSYSRNAEDYA